MLGGSSSNFGYLVSEIVSTLDPESILELGCGSGEFLKNNIKYRNKVMAIQRLFGNSDNQVLEELGYKVNDQDILDFFRSGFDESFDLILCTDVIEHFLRSDALSIIDFSLYRGKYLLLVWPSAHPQRGDESVFELKRYTIS